MNYTDIQEATIAKLKALAAAQKFDSFESALPPGYETQYQNNAPLPYVLYEFGGKNTDEVNTGITGTRDDLKFTTFILEVHAPDPASRRALANLLRDNFTGYSPSVEWGEFVERHSLRYQIQQPFNAEFWPPRFAESIAYVLTVDA